MLRWFKWMYNFYLKHKSERTDVSILSLIAEFSVLGCLYLFLPQHLKTVRIWKALCNPSCHNIKQEAISNALSWSIFVFQAQCLKNPPAGSRVVYAKGCHGNLKTVDAEQRLFPPSGLPHWSVWLTTCQNFWLMCSLQSRAILTHILSSCCFHSIIVPCMGQIRVQVLSVLGWPRAIVCFCLDLSRRQANISKLANFYNLCFS